MLCKYGIEYIDDPATGKKVPTCHRSSFDSIREDENLGLAIKNTSPNARKLYQEEAKQIEQLRKGIIEVSSKEAPYGVFICYKETETPESPSQSIIVPETTVPVTTAPPETIAATTPAPTGFLSVAAGGWISAGLDADGTAVAGGRNHYGQCNVSGWSGIVAIEAGYGHTVALTSDGRVAAVGRNDYGMCDVFSW